MLDMLALVALSPWLERVRRRRRRRLPPPRDETDDCREPSSPVKPPDDDAASLFGCDDVGADDSDARSDAVSEAV